MAPARHGALHGRGEHVASEQDEAVHRSVRARGPLLSQRVDELAELADTDLGVGGRVGRGIAAGLGDVALRDAVHVVEGE
jgi:hypothetical protein